MSTVIIDVDPGRITRVYVAGAEDDVETVAAEHIGTEERAIEVIYHPEGAVYEVVFDAS